MRWHCTTLPAALTCTTRTVMLVYRLAAAEKKVVVKEREVGKKRETEPTPPGTDGGREGGWGERKEQIGSRHVRMDGNFL